MAAHPVEAVLASAPVGLIAADADGTCRFVNDALLQLSGLGREQILDRHWGEIIHPEDRGLMISLWDQAGPHSPALQLVCRLGHAGCETWVLGQLAHHRPAGGGEAVGFVVAMTDISNHGENLTHLMSLGHYDPATGLPNRALVADRFRQAASLADRNQSKVGLLRVVLDDFKLANDSLGPIAGGTLLRLAAERFVGNVREADTVSRVSGDEFLLLLADIRETQAVARVVAKIQAAFRERFIVDGHDLSCTVSIGVAVYPTDGPDFSTLARKADVALSQARAAGHGSYRFFDERMNTAIKRQFLLQNELRRALEREELELFFQPVVRVGDDRIVGAEALLRWRHPERGLVPPDDFIPTAETSGLIVPMGRWVLNDACRRAAAWQHLGMGPLFVAVNLSVTQFANDDIVAAVVEALDRSGLDPSLLEVELTETVMIENMDSILESVQRLKALGVRFSIDDFGTGYSNLGYLRQLQLDKLKIDRSFVTNMFEIAEDPAIVRAIIQMARSLNVETVAEGVENIEEWEYLKQQGCDFGQGYLFSRPVPEEAFLCLL
jgi:diguanylate cyclase (GGDEF)-like protein/PAS domain S-box-containing protein